MKHRISVLGMVMVLTLLTSATEIRAQCQTIVTAWCCDKSTTALPCIDCICYSPTASCCWVDLGFFTTSTVVAAPTGVCGSTSTITANGCYFAWPVCDCKLGCMTGMADYADCTNYTAGPACPTPGC